MPQDKAQGAVQVCDPVTLEIVRGALLAIQSEMEAVIERTAMSPFIREKKDFYAALYDDAGRLIVGSNLPVFGDVVGPIAEHYPLASMRPGDIYWFNDCYASKGAVSHSPDQVFVAPVFAEGELVAFAQSWAHFNDIGGMRAGSLSPDCTEIFQEGIIVPPVRVVREGVVADELLRVFWRNSRFPDMVKGDTRASMAAIRLGERRVVELIGRFGRAQTASAFAQLIAETARELRQRLRALVPEGRHEFTDTIDTDGQGHGPVKLRYQLEVTSERICLNTSKSDDQVPGPINFLMSPAVPAMVFGSYLLGGDNGPRPMLNAGVEQAIDEVVLRPGSILMPHFPAPLGMRGITMMRNMAVCLGLLNVATRGRAMAAHSAYVIWYLRGRDPSGELFLLSDGLGVGYGARPTADGNDAVYLVAQENFPAEFLEQVFPVRVRGYAINPDTGGPGRWRGGCGLIRELEVLAREAMVSMRIDSVEHPPWGVAGGRAAGAGRCVINPDRSDARVIHPLSDGNMVKRGDIVRIETGGGGGWGHPFDREPERVAADVRNGFVSQRSARVDYGVVLREGEMFLDEEATANERASRPEAGLFHRHSYCDVLD
ncbi:MAG TPA: hydantoinase B/oxoprolinase family protein [Hyphomicrobiaceae bacterium]|nr:hydantoinase B/oxoprolinase family protein [Hyphomicrobiaceae bacterium]